MASSFKQKLFRIIDPIFPLANSIYAIPRYLSYWKDYYRFKKISKGNINFPINFYPAIHEKSSAHEFDSHYQFQAIWAGEKILSAKPQVHYDVASQMNFCLMLSLSLPVEFIDFRELHLQLKNFTSKKGSLLDLPYASDSLSSLSCLHVIEHIGLGRYGDPLSASGTIDASKELTRVLKPGGNLYISAPIGHSRIEFNSHRIHTPEQIIHYFAPLELIEFSVIDDNGNYLQNVKPQNYSNAAYSCGLFHFKKSIPS